MFPYNNFLTRRINITRTTVLLVGLFVFLFGILHNYYYPQFYDPFGLRVILSFACIGLCFSSFYFRFVRRNFDFLLYVVFFFVILWIEYTLYKNNLHAS